MFIKEFISEAKRQGEEALNKIGFCHLLIFISVSLEIVLLSWCNTLVSIPLYWSNTARSNSKRV